MVKIVLAGWASDSFAGAGGGAGDLAQGLQFTTKLAFCEKIGSSLSVKRHQESTKFGIAARQRRFFFGFAEQNPYVFLGGEFGKLRGESRAFLFDRHCRFLFGILEVDTN